jgi:hypothetical protein
MVDEVTMGPRMFSEFIRYFPANNYSTIALHVSVTAPLRCAVSLTNQHVIASLVFKVAASE